MKRIFATTLTVCLILGIALCLSSAKQKPATLFMVGDSTMADKTELEASPERGWGQLFQTFATADLRIENHAKNGRSTKNFIAEGRWDFVLGKVQKGDIVVIQFGHNDIKKDDPERYASIEDYQKNLTKMVTDIQNKHAYAILATPIARRAFKNGKIINKHGAYPEAMKRVAIATNTPLVDMTKLTTEWLEKLGDEESIKYFMHVEPGECTKFPDGKTDNTHLREAGAIEIGKLFAEEVIRLNIKPLCKYLTMEGDTAYTEPCGIK